MQQGRLTKLTSAKMNEQISVFAPGTVANVGPGFDILGFALADIGDIVTAKLSPGKTGVSIVEIKNSPNLPLDVMKNTAGFASLSTLKAIRSKECSNDFCGVDLIIDKRMPLGSGLGSSASSAVAAALATNLLLGSKLTMDEIIPIVVEAEAVACGAAHPDNVVPSLMGGITLITNNHGSLVTRNIPTEISLNVLVCTPDIEIKTSDARRIMPQTYDKRQVFKQVANVAGLIYSLMANDIDMLKNSLIDHLAEPFRAYLIPGFMELREKILNQSGGINLNISGSGPTIFSLVTKDSEAQVRKIIENHFTNLGIQCTMKVCGLVNKGAHVV